MFLSFLRARINEGLFLIANISIFMNRTNFDSIWWKHATLPPIGKYVLHIVIVFWVGITQYLAQYPADNHDCRWERRRAWSRARRRMPLFCWRRRLGS